MIRRWKSGGNVKLTCTTHSEALSEAERLEGDGYDVEVSRDRLWIVRGSGGAASSDVEDGDNQADR